MPTFTFKLLDECGDEVQYVVPPLQTTPADDGKKGGILMTIWLIEFSDDTRWIPTSKPYYLESEANKALARHKSVEREYRVAKYVRVEASQ